MQATPPVFNVECRFSRRNRHGRLHLRLSTDGRFRHCLFAIEETVLRTILGRPVPPTSLAPSGRRWSRSAPATRFRRKRSFRCLEKCAPLEVHCMIQVLFFGVLRDIVGTPGETSELPVSTLGEVFEAYATRFPRLREVLSVQGSTGPARRHRYSAISHYAIGRLRKPALMPAHAGGGRKFWPFGRGAVRSCRAAAFARCAHRTRSGRCVITSAWFQPLPVRYSSASNVCQRRYWWNQYLVRGGQRRRADVG
jgi:molybdopterin converting factor small subunit